MELSVSLEIGGELKFCELRHNLVGDFCLLGIGCDISAGVQKVFLKFSTA